MNLTHQELAALVLLLLERQRMYVYRDSKGQVRIGEDND